jgi:alpha-glucosidase
MYFHKTVHPRNFNYHKLGEIALNAAYLGEDVYRLSYASKRWKDHGSDALLSPDVFNKKQRSSSVETRDVGFQVLLGGEVLLSTREGEDFGVSGSKWIVNFEPEDSHLYYGLGEKNNGFEKTGTRTKFYNTDVWTDFEPVSQQEGITDPMYASVPYLLLGTKNGWAGILVNNPYPVTMLLQPEDSIAGGLHGASRLPRHFSIAAPGGMPELYIITGTGAGDVTSRLQRLVGTAPLPPLWALGYHQSRWGYGSFADLDLLDKKFAEEKIPCDGLWLDIDYMDGFRIFTFNEKYFPHPKNQIEDLKKRGRRVIPILDPGVKEDPGFDVYNELIKKNVYCRTAEGLPFIGMVWPGETVFPDFAAPEGREWWVGRVKKFAELGFEGFWIDMNDPSTGCVDPEDMLFGKGKISHEAYHNQYSLGIQKATWEGLREARPSARPFLVSRSAFISSSRYGAVWTGDNWSNRHHLRGCIPLCLNLSLSGIPFCGPDVPGFGGDADAALVAAWFKACFLFPFLRNHSVKGSRPQEPWAFGEKTKAVVRRYIRLRYKMLPYLYNLFIRQEERGEPILRPLFYDFPDTPETSLTRVEDEFLVGPSVLQAPVLDEGAGSRTLLLPGTGLRWFSASEGTWAEGNGVREVKESLHSTPLFFREGAIVPMLPGEPETQEKNLAAVEFHVFLAPETGATGDYTYTFDDGETPGYRKGMRTSFRLSAAVTGKILRVEVKDKTIDYLPCTLSFVLYGRFEKVVLLDSPREEHLVTEKAAWDFLGKKLTLRRTRETIVKK